MKVVRVSVFFPVLLAVNLVSRGVWYCNECDTAHSHFCTVPLFDNAAYDLTAPEIVLLKRIQTDIEKLDVKSRIVIILRLMYTHDSNFWKADSNPDKNVINWRALKLFSWNLWSEISEKEEIFSDHSKYSDPNNVSGAIAGLEAYLENEAHYVGSNIDSFEPEVMGFMKSIAQNCSSEDLKCVLDMLALYEDSKYDTAQIMQIIIDALGLKERPTLSHLSPIDFLQIARDVFTGQALCIPALRGPATDASTPGELYDLLFRRKESETQIAEIMKDIESLLMMSKNLSIMQIVEKLMGKYAFSLGAIAPCYFLCHWMGIHLDLEAYAKKLK